MTRDDREQFWIREIRLSNDGDGLTFDLLRDDALHGGREPLSRFDRSCSDRSRGSLNCLLLRIITFVYQPVTRILEPVVLLIEAIRWKVMDDTELLIFLVEGFPVQWLAGGV